MEPLIAVRQEDQIGIPNLLSPPDNYPFKDVEENLHKPKDASTKLTTLLLRLENDALSNKQYQKLYELLATLLPQLIVERNWLSTVQILLNMTNQLRSEQQTLALRIAQHFGSSCDLLSSYKIPFHYFAKAIKINVDNLIPHQEASLLFFQLVRLLFRERLEELRRRGNVQKFETAIKEMGHLLTSFMVIPQHQEDLCLDAQRIIHEASQATLGNYRSCLTAIRTLETQSITLGEPVSKRYHQALVALRQKLSSPQDMFHYWKTFIKEQLIRDCFAILGDPPCRYDIRAMGSLGKKEPCPFSDLEYFILVEDDQWRPYFVKLALLLEMQVIFVGETASNEFPVFTVLGSSNLSGFHIDQGAGDGNDWIRTPDHMAEHQRLNFIGPNTLQITSLQSSSLVTDSPDLFTRYIQKANERLDELQDGVMRRKRYARELLRMRVLDFNKYWRIPFSLELQSLHLKDQYILLLNYLLTDLALYFRVEATGSRKIISSLVDRKIFTAASGYVLQEVIEAIYAIRIRIHNHYGYQNDEVSYLKTVTPNCAITISEFETLEQAYWLVILPLYTRLEKIVDADENQFESQFNNIDLLDDAFELQKGKKHESLKRVTYHIAKTLCRPEVSYHHHLKYYQQLTNTPYRKNELRFLYLQTLAGHNSPHIARLADISDVKGIRCSYRNRQHFLRKAIERIPQSKTMQKDDRGISVKVTTSWAGGARYLNSAVIGKLLKDDGRMRKCDPDSIHNVFYLESPALHFKEEPFEPLMEYAIHDLSYRVGGYVTPTVELVRFDVNVNGESISYPVLVSETITGVSLKKALLVQAKCDQAQWTRMFIATLLIRPGDGRSSNYIVTAMGQVFCVDNDISFVEPLTSNAWRGKTIHFCSALFCLFSSFELDKAVLQEFIRVDSSSLLTAWLEEIISKEKVWLGLFSEQEQKQLFEDSNKVLTHRFEERKGCRLNILLREGTLAHLDLQILSLQKFLKPIIERGQSITAHQLLEQLISLKHDETTTVTTGRYVAQSYQRSMSRNTFDLRLQDIVNRDTRHSILSSQFDMISLGGAPEYEKVKNRTLFSPELARKELFRTLLRQNSSLLVFKEGISEDSLDSFYGNFDESISESRQSIILAAIAYFIFLMEKKPSVITIENCVALTSEFLSPLLHEGVISLTIIKCPNIRDVSMLVKLCPNLQKLRFIDCEKLERIGSLSYFPAFIGKYWNTYPDRMLKLQSLEVRHCDLFRMVILRSYELKRVVLKDLPTLEVVEIPTQRDVVEEEMCPQLKSCIKDVEGVRDSYRSKLANLSKTIWIFWGKEEDKDLQVIEKRGVLSTVKKNGLALAQVDVKWQDDEEVVSEAVKQNGMALQNASLRLKALEVLVLDALMQNGLSFEFVAPELQKKKAIALAAVRQNGFALELVNAIFKNDDHVVDAAIQQNFRALMFASKPQIKKRTLVEV